METLTSSQDAESISATTAVASYEKSWYNGFNQMVGTKVDGVEATYSYAPSGLRLSKTIDGTTIDYALDGDFVAAELNGDTVTARYNRGLELVGSTIGDTTSYYLYNAHGDVVNLTNTSGAATKSYEYDAFGNEVNPAADDTNPFRYCGEYFDAETGRIYLRARYYDPVLGRMLAEDTNWDSQNRILGENEQPDIYVILQGANLYVYCNGNPIFFIDGTGFEWYSSAFNKTAGISVNLGPFGQGYYAGNDGELKRLQPELGASASVGGNLANIGYKGRYGTIEGTIVSATADGSIGIGGLGGGISADLVNISGSTVVEIPIIKKKSRSLCGF